MVRSACTRAVRDYASVFKMKYRRRWPRLHVALIQPPGDLRDSLRLHHGGRDVSRGRTRGAKGHDGDVVHLGRSGAWVRRRGAAVAGVTLSAQAHLHTLQQLGSLAELVQLRLLAVFLHRAPVDEHLEGEREDHRLQHRGHLRRGSHTGKAAIPEPVGAWEEGGDNGARGRWRVYACGDP
jgi:hypothetical protein